MSASSHLEDDSGEMKGRTEPGTLIDGKAVFQKVYQHDFDEPVQREELESALRNVLETYEERGWETEIEDETLERDFYISKEIAAERSLLNKINPLTPRNTHYCLGVAIPHDLEEVEEFSIYNDSRYHRERVEIPDGAVETFASEIIQALE